MTQLPMSGQWKKSSGIIFPTAVWSFSSRRSGWRESIRGVLAKPPSPPSPLRGDNTRKQPAEAYLGNKRTFSGVSFSHPELQNMPSYPRCYWASYNTPTWDSVSQRMRVCACMTGLVNRFTHVNQSPISEVAFHWQAEETPCSHVEPPKSQGSVAPLGCTTWPRGCPDFDVPIRSSAVASFFFFFHGFFLCIPTVMWLTWILFVCTCLCVVVSEPSEGLCLYILVCVCGKRLWKEFHGMIGFPCQPFDKLSYILRNSLTCCRRHHSSSLFPVKLLICKHSKYFLWVFFREIGWVLNWTLLWIEN